MKASKIILGMISLCLAVCFNIRAEDIRQNNNLLAPLTKGDYEYLIKFKTDEPVVIKGLEEKYRVTFKPAIPALHIYSFQNCRHKFIRAKESQNDTPLTPLFRGDYETKIINSLKEESIVEYVEPNGLARTTYADLAEVQEIITDAPWYLAPDRKYVPVLLFVPEVYWRRKDSGGETGPIDKETGVQISEFILANPPDATSDWSFADNWKPSKNIIYHDTYLSPPKIMQPVVNQNNKIIIENEFGRESVIDTKAEIKDGIIRENKDTGRIKPITEPGWHRILLIPREELIGTGGLRVNLAGDVYLSTYVSYQRWFIKQRLPKHARYKDEKRWTTERDEKDHSIVMAYPKARMLKVKVGQKQNGGLPRFNANDRYYDIHNHTMSEYSTELVEPRLAYGGPLRMVELSAYALGMIDIDEHKKLEGQNKIFSSDHNCFLQDADIPEVGPYKEYITQPQNEYEVLKKWFGTKTGAQEVTLNSEHQGLRSAYSGSHLLVYEHPKSLEGPWHGGRQNLKDSVDNTVQNISTGLNYAGSPGLAQALPILAPTASSTLQKSAGVNPFEENENTLNKVMDALIKESGQSISAHPLNKNLYWDDGMFSRALGFPPYHQKGKNLNDKTKQFVFRGFQGWNDPEKYKRTGLKPEDFQKLNPFYTPRVFIPLTSNDYKNWADFEKTFTRERGYVPPAFMKDKELTRAIGGRYQQTPEAEKSCSWAPDFQWHGELGRSLIKWMGLVQRGFHYYFEKNPQNPKEIFIRKNYFYAGSDAHGNFNYSEGVWFKSASTVATADNEIYDNAYARERTYVLGENVDAVHQGQCINTDGPLVEFMMDSDGKFDSSRLVWHDKKVEYENDDGLIGGSGNLDGGRTMLVRRESPVGKGSANSSNLFAAEGRHKICQSDRTRLMLKYRWDNTADFSEKVNLIDLYDISGTGFETETIQNAVVPKPLFQLEVPTNRQEYLACEFPKGRTNLTGLHAFYLGGFTNSNPVAKYYPDDYRCFTNPVWLVPVEIEIIKVVTPTDNFVATQVPTGKPSPTPVETPSGLDPATSLSLTESQSVKNAATAGIPYYNGKGGQITVPAGYWQFNFKFPVSMKAERYRAAVRMLDAEGKSTGPEYPLTGGSWDKYNNIADAIYYGLTNSEITFQSSGYPNQSQQGFVVYLYSRRDEEAGGRFNNARGLADMNGNYLNPIARAFTVELPAAVESKTVETKGKKPQPVTTPAGRTEQTKQGKGAEFYEMPIEKHAKKIVFVLDTSFSMGIDETGKMAVYEETGSNADGTTAESSPTREGPKVNVHAQGTKLDTAKKELTKTISGLDNSVMYNIVCFNEVAIAWQKEFTHGGIDQKKALNWLNTQESGKYTNIYEALEKAFLTLGPEQKKTVIFLVSDGVANRGITEPEEILAAVARWNPDKKVTINTIGLWGKDTDETTGPRDPHTTKEMKEKGERFLKDLAGRNNGTYIAK